uniref:Uncharacterized protein n=1 Tax=Anguilla anguilla TaxID=7936 RepID=A0A0E9WH43_ANGAN
MQSHHQDNISVCRIFPTHQSACLQQLCLKYSLLMLCLYSSLWSVKKQQLASRASSENVLVSVLLELEEVTVTKWV